MYDAIIVGARCAGSPTAMLLARKGYRVLLVDKATFPSDVVNGYYLHQTAVARLKYWGLLDKLRASNCPPLLTLTFDFGGLCPDWCSAASGRCRRGLCTTAHSARQASG